MMVLFSVIAALVLAAIIGTYVLSRNDGYGPRRERMTGTWASPQRLDRDDLA
jgi:hypothetical protein